MFDVLASQLRFYRFLGLEFFARVQFTVDKKPRVYRVDFVN